jgi:hypothetical protein
VIGNAGAGYSLRPLSASYFGPLADLTNSAGTPVTNTYSAVGGALDPAAATFCAANPPCLVSKLYFQGEWNTTGNTGTGGILHDVTLDATATGSLRPSVTFNSLNGRPTMHFSGAQYLRTQNWGPAYTIFSPPYLVTAVMRRTGGFTSYSAGYVSTAGGNTAFDGLSNAASTARANENGGSAVTGTASDGTWHAIQANMITGGSSLIADGASVGTGTATPATYSTYGCIGGDQGAGGQYQLTGDIAEIDMVSLQNASGTPLNLAPQTFTLVEGAWGTLPN